MDKVILKNSLVLVLGLVAGGSIGSIFCSFILCRYLSGGAYDLGSSLIVIGGGIAGATIAYKRWWGTV